MIGHVVEDHFDGDADAKVFDGWMKMHLPCHPENGRSAKVKEKHKPFIQRAIEIEDNQ